MHAPEKFAIAALVAAAASHPASAAAPELALRATALVGENMLPP